MRWAAIVANAGKKLLFDDKGTVTIIVAAAMVALIGFCSLVVDIGNLFLTRQRLNNALDAAVLAGVQELPGSPDEARDKAARCFTDNGMDMAFLTGIDISGDRRTITATGQANVKFFLARVLGITSSTVSCTSTARVDLLTSATDLVPVGIKEPPPGQTLEPGREYDLKISARDASHDDWYNYLGPGNCGLLDFPGGPRGKGSSEWREDFMEGYDGWLSVGDEIETIPGNRSGPVKQVLDDRLNKAQDCNCYPGNYDRYCPRVVLVPVYVPVGEPDDDNKVRKVEITGFALVHLSSYVGNGHDSYIKAVLIGGFAEGESDPGTTGGDFGVYNIKLVK